MSHKRISRNDPCPCGSGKKYKKCCWGKGLAGETETGNVFPDMPHSEHLEDMMVEEMQAAGVDPAVIYAYEQTGLIVTEENQDRISEDDLAAWQDAIDEYEADRQAPAKPPQYPLGTVALYGPDDRTTTKIAAGVILHETAAPIIKRWVSTKILENSKVQAEVEAFFTEHGVKSVVMTDGNMGCPHEEGPDFPVGEDCPFCPFWKGKQGSRAAES